MRMNLCDGGTIRDEARKERLDLLCLLGLI